MAEGLFDAGQNQDLTEKTSYDAAIYNLLYRSNLDFLNHTPREPVVFEPPSDDEFVVRSRGLMFELEGRQPLDFNPLSRPRWREDTDEHDDTQPRPPCPPGDIRDLQRHALNDAHNNFLKAGGEDVLRQLERAAQSSTIVFDPDSPASILRAAGGLLGPLVRSVSERLVNGSTANSCPVRPLPIRPLQMPATTSEALRRASGLPEGPIVPEVVKQVTGRALDGVIARKPQLAMAAAVVVTGSVVAQAAAISAKPTPAEAATTGRHPAIEAAPAPKAVAAAPKVAEVVEVPFTYKTSEKASVQAVANAMQASSKDMLRANPGMTLNDELPIGTEIGGMIRGSKITLPAPVNVEYLARAYGLPVDAIKSVNKVNANGLMDGDIIIPGRQVITTNSDQSVDVNAVAQLLQLSETGLREANRVNQQAPPGELVLPLSAAVENQTEQIETVVAEVATPLAPTVPPATATPTTIPAPTTLPTSMLDSSTTTIAPETTIPITTTTQPPTELATTTSVATTAQPPLAPVEAVPVAPEPVPPIAVERPANEVEKFEAERAALSAALEHARTTGDIGPLNHIVTYSPLFRPYDLPNNVQTGNIRYLPPSSLIDIPGLIYEFREGTTNHLRLAAAPIVAVILLAAYSMQVELATNQEYQGLRGACLRVGDLAAHDGHATHDGDEVDLSSAMQCDINNGRAQTDGPIFWINRSTGEPNSRVDNPNYNQSLERFVLGVMLNANIEGESILRRILYNADGLQLSKIQKLKNHNNHIHLDALNNEHIGGPLKEWAQGGDWPEHRLDDLRKMVFLAYAGGQGVPGVTLDLKITEFVSAPAGLEPMSGAVIEAVAVPTLAPAPVAEVAAVESPAQVPDAMPAPQAELDQAAQLLELAVNPTEGMKHAFVRTLLLNEIAKGEGGYDSSNRGHAGDMQVGDANYQDIFGNRPLSQHTLAELMELQRKGLIFTIGRYQLIPDTTRGAVEATGFDVNRVFDATAQDELAVNYLIFMKRPNLSAYIKGDESKLYKAIEDLCMEFASMPCNDGNGYYDGDSAGNDASGGSPRVASIREILNHLRITYLTAQAEINAATAA